MSVRIYVEGGGDRGSTKAACRQGFHDFFRKVVPEGAQPKIIASGSRRDAYKDFCAALRGHQDATILLLVDSEGPVRANSSAWAHLKERRDDNWDKPEAATEEQANLMVQCMEAWFLADRDVLHAYFGEEFKANCLPGQPNVECIPKQDVLASLEDATRLTQKGAYHKTRDGFEILGRIDPAKVRQASPFAERLCALLA